MVNLVTKNFELEDAPNTIVGAMEQKKVTVTETSPISNTSNMKKMFAAFRPEQKPPESPNEPSTSVIEKRLQKVLDGIKGNTRNVRRSKKPLEPNPKFIFYCDSHDFNKTHISCGY